MPAVYLNQVFARAERAFAGGRLDEARADLREVQVLSGDHPTVLHLLALVEKKRGAKEEARKAFVRAVAVAPTDPEIRTNYANLLADLGELEEALAQYDQALTTSPLFQAAQYNKALLLQRQGRSEEALGYLDVLAGVSPHDATIQSARGIALRTLGRIHDAAEAFDRALREEPGRPAALHGRARVAMERGEPGASARFMTALKERPGEPELVLGLAEALEAEGDASGIAVLKDVVANSPEWVLGHEVLARMRAEAGETAGFADHYRLSLQSQPGNGALHQSYWQTLAKAQRQEEALEALQRAKAVIGESLPMLMAEAILSSETGDQKTASALFDRLEDDGLDGPDLWFERGRAALRINDAERAAALLEKVVEADSNSIGGWAHLDLAWRLAGDERHHWLSGQPGLHGTCDLGLADRELHELRDLLRAFHRTRAHPIGQSLRGGTQTRGRLFWRTEPAIKQLHDAITAAVEAHFEHLPPQDHRHPLLRHRESRVSVEGSWSVRLTGHGFHVNHIHPQGILSSACYISVPTSLGSGDGREGWLELGRPPAELGLPIEPLAQVEPRPGRLVLFPSYLFHGTRPFPAGERLSVAFDVVAR